MQWTPAGAAGGGGGFDKRSVESMVPDAHDPATRHSPMMFTTDLALREDPAYVKITAEFRENPEAFSDAFARAWFKLTAGGWDGVGRFGG